VRRCLDTVNAMYRPVSLLAPAIALALCACVVAPPPGPTVMALPGQGKNLEAFQQDDAAVPMAA